MVDVASVFVGILEVADGLLIPDVFVPVPLDPRGPADALPPRPEFVLEVGFVVEERGSFAPVVLLPKWLPWPVVAPVCTGSPDCPEPYMTWSSFVLPGFLEPCQQAVPSAPKRVQAYMRFLILSMIAAK